MDLRTRRLFMACDTEMVVVNADDGSVVSPHSGAEPSGSELLRSGHQARVQSQSRRQHDDGRSRGFAEPFSVVQKVPTGGGARTCAVDEKTHKVYVFYYEGTTRENAQLVMAVLAP